MTLEHTRFGAIEYSNDDVLQIPDGLIGFMNLRNFVILSHNPESPFRWLQSIDEPGLAFLLADPARYLSDYAVDISDQLAQELSLSVETATLIYTTASIPAGKPKELTLNLAAPIVINAEQRIGKQVIVENEAYTMRYRVFASEERVGEAAAA